MDFVEIETLETPRNHPAPVTVEVARGEVCGSRLVLVLELARLGLVLKISITRFPGAWHFLNIPSIS